VSECLGSKPIARLGFFRSQKRTLKRLHLMSVLPQKRTWISTAVTLYAKSGHSALHYGRRFLGGHKASEFGAVFASFRPPVAALSAPFVAYGQPQEKLVKLSQKITWL